MNTNQHYSVLLRESVDALITDPNGVYIDGTFGRGGHSREILRCLSADARLIAFDKDPVAVEAGNTLANTDERFSIVHDSFSQMPQFRERVPGLDNSTEGVNGVLLDLGVSSPQLDVAERGFSFLQDGPLDMRMNNTSGKTAAQWVNSAEESEIAFVLREYGEEKFSRRMARAVVEARSEAPIERTAQLAKIISEANPRWEKGKHPATRAFQAVRIFINRELEELSMALNDVVGLLKPGGRLVVISFHSLEDRIVKRFIRDKSRGKRFPLGVPVTEEMLEKELRTVGKAVKAGERELEENIRSRSAVMRVAEKI